MSKSPFNSQFVDYALYKVKYSKIKLRRGIATTELYPTK